jgi:hypothetical protein
MRGIQCHPPGISSKSATSKSSPAKNKMAVRVQLSLFIYLTDN